jgi:uncharacterized protein (TIGR02118 family)
MIAVTVMYPKTEGSTFDFEYYLDKHIPLAKARFGEFGLMDVRLVRGSGLMDGAPPMYTLIGELVFPSLQNVQDAVAKHGAEIMADIPNFSNVQPVIQISESL